MRRSQKLLHTDPSRPGKPVAFTSSPCGRAPHLGRNRGTGPSVGAIKDDLVNAGLLWEDSAVVVDGNPDLVPNAG